MPRKLAHGICAGGAVGMRWLMPSSVSWLQAACSGLFSFQLASQYALPFGSPDRLVILGERLGVLFHGRGAHITVSWPCDVGRDSLCDQCCLNTALQWALQAQPAPSKPASDLSVLCFIKWLNIKCIPCCVPQHPEFFRALLVQAVLSICTVPLFESHEA